MIKEILCFIKPNSSELISSWSMGKSIFLQWWLFNKVWKVKLWFATTIEVHYLYSTDRFHFTRISAFASVFTLWDRWWKEALSVSKLSPAWAKYQKFLNLISRQQLACSIRIWEKQRKSCDTARFFDPFYEGTTENCREKAYCRWCIPHFTGSRCVRWQIWLPFTLRATQNISGDIYAQFFWLRAYIHHFVSARKRKKSQGQEITSGKTMIMYGSGRDEVVDLMKVGFRWGILLSDCLALVVATKLILLGNLYPFQTDIQQNLSNLPMVCMQRISLGTIKGKQLNVGQLPCSIQGAVILFLTMAFPAPAVFSATYWGRSWFKRVPYAAMSQNGISRICAAHPQRSHMSDLVKKESGTNQRGCRVYPI